MSGRDKRKQHDYEYDDRLGFNPNRYLAKRYSRRGSDSHSNHNSHRTRQNTKSNRDEKKLTKKAAYHKKPSLDRHKAHSSNRRKRRALYVIRKMQWSADRAQRTRSCPLNRAISDHQSIRYDHTV